MRSTITEALDEMRRLDRVDAGRLRGVDPGVLRVARHDDPTRTWWVRIGPDLAAARHTVGEAIGDTADHALVITAVGYGHHGDHADRLPLPLLCAMQQVAGTHQVSLRT